MKGMKAALMLTRVLWISTLAPLSCRVSVATTTNEDASDETVDCKGRLALVTGGTGRVGSMVSEMLVKQGYCLRIFTRSEEKANEKLRHVLDQSTKPVELAVGDLGNAEAIHEAFEPRESSGYASVSHVIFAAGGEEADYDAVNHRAVAECASEASRVRAKSMVVISAAWVSKPYSLASLLFNSLYPSLPMARHLQGEHKLRREAAHEPMNYVILRAGRLVPDDGYPKGAATGLLYDQGDSFFFFGPAGLPGMCNSQLANAVMTALQVQGKYTVEITGGNEDAHDASVYNQFIPDGTVPVRHEDVEYYHAKALFDLKIAGVLLFVNLAVVLLFSPGLLVTLMLVLSTVGVFVGYWTLFLSDLSVLDCVRRNVETEL